jgi:hypothetical protein
LLFEPSEELRNGALAQARQLRLHFSASWDPYEVWYTRVRSEGEREAALRTPVERIAPHRAQGSMTPAARVVQVLFGISAICAVVMALRLAGYRLMPPW